MKHTYIHAYIHGYPTPLTAHSLAEVVLPIEVDGEPMWFAKEPVGLLGLSGLWNFSTTGASEINRHDESSTPKLKAPLSRKEGKMPPQTMNQTPPEPEAPKPEASPEALNPKRIVWRMVSSRSHIRVRQPIWDQRGYRKKLRGFGA